MKFEVKFILECPDDFEKKYEEAIKNNPNTEIGLAHAIFYGLKKVYLIDFTDDISMIYFRAGIPSDSPNFSKSSEKKTFSGIISRNLLKLKSFFSIKKNSA